MISLQHYIFEKLTINKKLSSYSGFDITEYVNTIISEYDRKTHSSNQLKYKEVECPAEWNYLVPKELRDDIDFYENGEKYCFIIYFRGNHKIITHIVFIENELLFVAFTGNISKTQLASIKDIMYDENFSFDKQTFTYIFNDGYFKYENVCSGDAFVDTISNILYKIQKEFNIRNDINTKKKPNEVLPGYTFNDIKQRYDSIFDDVRLMKTGNVKLGRLCERGFYGSSDFTIYCDIDYNNGVLIRKTSGGGIGHFVHEADADAAFNKLDEKLKKRGYSI